jgi:hypothetical protein
MVRIRVSGSNGFAGAAAPCAASFAGLAAHGYANITPHEEINIAAKKEG